MKLNILPFLLWLSVASALPDYRLALPGYEYQFPRDHGNHADFKLEWWYFTGNLESRDGKRFGYELTFFRTGLEEAASSSSRWQVRDLYPAHFAVSDLDSGRFYYFEKLNRTSPAIAGAQSEGLSVWNENWSARMQDGRIYLQARAEASAIELELHPTKAPVVHGSNGVSQKGSDPGRASHYYSLTRMTTRGWLTTPGGSWRVGGLSWMDHEFGTNQLEPEQVGWDWFSLQLDNHYELMLFQIRRADGSIDPHSAGTVVAPDGNARHLASSEFQLLPLQTWKSPATGGIYPVAWCIRIPQLEVDLSIRAVMDDQELNTVRSTGAVYWEGAVEASGRWRGGEVSARGYLEMTGYAPQSRPRI